MIARHSFLVCAFHCSTCVSPGGKGHRFTILSSKPFLTGIGLSRYCYRHACQFGISALGVLYTKFLLSLKALLCCRAAPNKAVILSGQLMKRLRDFGQMWEELHDIIHKSELSISSLHVSLGIRLLFCWDLP